MAGYRGRTFFLCPLTGKYDFYFSCNYACDWIIKESEQSQSAITGGNTDMGMPPQDFNQFRAVPSANFTEGHAYYIEILLFQPADGGHFHLKVKDPRSNTSVTINKESLVAYQENGQYDPQYPGEWEAWSPCSTPCGPDGRQSRNRSCLIYPSIFNYSTDGYELTESRACNTEVLPCKQDSCKALPIILSNNNLTSFTIPFNASILPDDPAEGQQSLDEHPPVWCFNDSVASYLELNFTDLYYICAIETQGVATTEPSERHMSPRTFLRFWSKLQLITVFEGNTYEDPFSRKINNLTEGNLVASSIRIWPVQSNAGCMRLKVYGQLAKAPSLPPANISVTATAANTIFISWEEVSEQERNGIVQLYKVYVTNGDQVVEHESIIDADVTSLEVSNLADNSFYCVQLLAYTVADGPLSACVNVTTLKKVPADAPQNVQVYNTSSKSLMVRWDHWRSYFAKGAVEGYHIDIKITQNNSIIKHIPLLGLEETFEVTDGLKKYSSTV
ncbi:hypothetical protein OS493_015493 [Desmophyllum pertusum]|uniref:Fibronectin type-III domain-containing protein n=1 Tax=Desmophyllum pertusum TaxID=174260 RepID=A0A9W9Z0Q1_9CNID|nr:hypothetical protein OS493_015493 [Desmophyllum pertusum]